MRLLDQIAQAPPSFLIDDSSGTHVMPGAGVDATRLAAVPLRYVLDREATRYLERMILSDSAMFVADNLSLRVPAEEFWLEWIEERHGLGRRVGVLVQADEAGRSGRMRSFWEDPKYGVQRSQGTLLFNFDDRISASTLASAKPPDFLRSLAENVAAQLDPEWRAHFLLQKAGVAAIPSALATLWADFAATLLFSAVLASRYVETSDTDFGRLNVSRARAGKPPLLDHLEVRLSLSQAPAGSREPGRYERRPSRLHLVRGHMVHRGDLRFWRCSHLRGDIAVGSVTRTVRVTADSRR